MPIKIPTHLPARRVLEREGVPLIDEDRAMRQDIRPLRVAVLNLMPEKHKTETQLARVLGATPLQVEMSLLWLTTHTAKTTSAEHITEFYRPWREVEHEKFDGLIVTGAPIEQLPFEDVFYWRELCEIFDWSRTHVHGLFNLCWGAQAALYHFYGIPKHALAAKAFGVYPHRVLNPSHPLTLGLNDEIPVPVSRHTENRRADFEGHPELEILVESPTTGLALVYDRVLNHVHMFNHLEYDSTTLDDEFKRDRAKGEAIQLPANYYPDDDPERAPVNCWRAGGHLLYANWLNLTYQTTPFDIERIGTPGDAETLGDPSVLQTAS